LSQGQLEHSSYPIQTNFLPKRKYGTSKVSRVQLQLREVYSQTSNFSIVRMTYPKDTLFVAYGLTTHYSVLDLSDGNRMHLCCLLTNNPFDEHTTLLLVSIPELLWLHPPIHHVFLHLG